MIPEDSDNKANFFYSKNGKNWIPLGEVTEVHCEVSDEDAAKLFALMDPMEIVPNAR